MRGFSFIKGLIMQELQVFENGLFGEIRTTLDENNEPWFVASDVTKALAIKNATQTVHALDEDERSMLNIGRQGKVHIISESGLYTLVMRSRKEEAVQFQKWVTKDVLPTIRKTGKYDISESTYIKKLKGEITQLEKSNNHLEKQKNAILDMHQKMHMENRKNSVGDISREIYQLCQMAEENIYSARCQMDMPKEHAKPRLEEIENTLRNIQVKIQSRNSSLYSAIYRERDRKIMQDVKNGDLESYYENIYQ